MSAFKNGPTNKHGTLLPRFYLDKNRYIIDRKNHSNSLLTDVPSELASDDRESSFRSHLLWHHLIMRLFPDLLRPIVLKLDDGMIMSASTKRVEQFIRHCGRSVRPTFFGIELHRHLIVNSQKNRAYRPLRRCRFSRPTFNEY